MKIGHFIITLFNLRLKWVGREKNLQEIDPGTDVNYLTKAFNRFETYTVPSMVNQSVQNFIWIVLFSSDTPLEFRMKLRGGGYCKQLVPLFLTDEEAKDYRGYLVKYLQTNYDYDKWITTRLDNDDAIASTFVEDIQKNVHNDIGNHVLSYPDGYQYDVAKNILCRYNFPNNHFTSYITIDKEKTIYDFGHINLVSQNETFYINAKKPMWVEIIHGENVYNRMGTINPFDYVKKANLKKEFGVTIAVRNNPIQLLFYYIYFALRKAWNKRSRLVIFIKRKLHLKYNDDRTDR